jgi:hypothetical protein
MFMTAPAPNARLISSPADAIRSLVRHSNYLFDRLEPRYAASAMVRWEQGGRQVPAPAAVKRVILRRAAEEHGLRVLVETGTFRGDTAIALRQDFSRVVSIELSPMLHAKAVRRARRLRNVEFLLGDSSQVLPGVLASLREPALFWLDAHYSGGFTALGDDVSPIVAELDAVLGHPVHGHVVLIDDAREFRDSARSGYPRPEVVMGAAARHGYTVTEEDDIFFLLPPNVAQGKQATHAGPR